MHRKRENGCLAVGNTALKSHPETIGTSNNIQKTPSSQNNANYTLNKTHTEKNRKMGKLLLEGPTREQ